MDVKKLEQAKQWVEKELASSAEFWLKYGMDKEHGGVYTCIDRTGRLFSTDKSVWMQGRCGWTYAYPADAHRTAVKVGEPTTIKKAIFKIKIK